MNFLRSLNPFNSASSNSAQDVISAQREIILQCTLYLLLIVSTGGLVFAFRGLDNPDFVSVNTVFFVAYLVLAVQTFLRGIPYTVRATTAVALLFGVGLSQLITNGVGGSGLLLLLMSVAVGSMLFNAQIGGILLLLNTGVVIFVGVQMVTGQMSAPEINDVTNSAAAGAWASAGAIFFLAASITAMAFMVMTNGIRRTMEKQHHLTKQLEDEQASLEQRVQDRAADLKKRLAQFEVASEIAREILLETNIPSLLDKAVSLISQRFQYYHVGIFLNDERKEFTVLRAAAGPTSQQMIERNHRLKIGEIGIVGNVVSKAEARIAMDVKDDIVHYKNPFLPDTRSEMALPLRFGGVAIGALDVQSIEENAFTVDDIKILQTVADQLAIALAKSQQVEQLQRSVQELEASHAQVIQHAWQGHLKTARQKFQYHYHDAQVENSAPESDHGKQALSSGQTVMMTINGDGPNRKETVLAVPIKLRNQVLGVIDIHFQGATVSSDLVALIVGTVDRLAVSLENARLLEEIQYRAERERLVGEISSRVRTASDVDSILRIAAQEIGRSLGVSEVMVQLRNSEQS